MCACLLSLDKSNRVIYTGTKSGSRHSFFSHANISNITDDRELGGRESCTANTSQHLRPSASYQGFLSAQQLDEEDQNTRETLSSKEI